MLPYSDHAPLEQPQFPRAPTVALPIGLDFGSPVAAIVLGHSVTTRASVPKAAVYKDRELLLAENEVGLARERRMSAPAGDSCRSKESCECRFGRFVPFRPNACHVKRPLLARKPIRHDAYLSWGGLNIAYFFCSQSRTCN